MATLGVCATCGHASTLHYGPEGVCVANCASLTPLVQCGCPKFVIEAAPSSVIPRVEEAFSRYDDAIIASMMLAVPQERAKAEAVRKEALAAAEAKVQAAQQLIILAVQQQAREGQQEKDQSRSDHPRVISTADPRGDDRGGPRYCHACDEYMKARECKACGMPTEKVPQ